MMNARFRDIAVLREKAVTSSGAWCSPACTGPGGSYRSFATTC